MQYNDYVEKYDPKIFEKLSKEYSQKYNKTTEIMTKNDTKTAPKTSDFLQKYEEFLALLLELNKQKNCTIFGTKLAKNKDLKTLTKNFCSIYLCLTGECYFSPSACNIVHNKDAKSQLLKVIKELIFAENKSLNEEQKNKFLDNIFELIFVIKRSDFLI